MKISQRRILKMIFAVSAFTLIAGCAKGQTKPEETEVWEPVPEIVRPGSYDRLPPSDAIVLLGEDLSAWESMDGKEVGWIVEEGIATVKPGEGDIRTKQSFGSVQLHVEWRTPAAIEEQKGQGRGNSGVFLQTFYEVQVLDSYKNRTYSNGQAGSLYKQHIPLVNAMRPPMEWQTYDIIYEAPEFDGEKLEKPAYITVIHNGVLIQNHVELKGETVFIGKPEYTPHGKLPLKLQDHGNLISYRNIWIRELD